jgi:3-oxoacyl-[acyl-carrier protein] reductase
MSTPNAETSQTTSRTDASERAPSGKVAVVTGGGRGIGAAIAERLGKDGYRVVVSYRSSRDGAETVVTRIRQSGSEATAVQADLQKRGDITRLFDQAEAAFGGVDLLVNNAGLSELRPLDQVDEAHVERVLDVNLGAVIHASQEAARRFEERGGGRILNLSSSFSTEPAPGSSVYAATKAGVNALTQALSRELGPQGITVNAVAPGPTETEGLKEAQGGEGSFEQAAGYLAGRTTLGRLGRPDDIAGVVSLLASADADWVTGQVVHAHGGFTP